MTDQTIGLIRDRTDASGADALAALPLLSVVREVFNQSPFGADYGGVEALESGARAAGLVRAGGPVPD